MKQEDTCNVIYLSRIIRMVEGVFLFTTLLLGAQAQGQLSQSSHVVLAFTVAPSEAGVRALMA